MIQDLNRFVAQSNLPKTSGVPPHSCDLCIIGGGAAGLLLAMQFVGTNVKVVVAESGSSPFEERVQALYNSDVTGLPHTGIHEGRFRIFGGSTARWGGQLLPLNKFDFEQRPWVPHSGWPFPLEELLPYYSQVEKILHTDTSSGFREEVFQKFGITAPAFNQELVRIRFSKWLRANQRNFASAWQRELTDAPNILILNQANVLRLDVNDSGDRVQGAVLRSFEGAELEVRAKEFVVSCGGIETARFLLASNHQKPAGLGNEHDLVGRFYQDHPSVEVGDIVTDNPRQVQHLFAPYFEDGILRTPRIELTADAQCRMGIPGVMGHIIFEFPETSAPMIAKRLVLGMQARTKQQISPKDVFQMIGGVGDLTRIAWNRAVNQRRSTPPNGRMILRVDIEQTPNPNSRITLSQEKDALGIPKTRLDWQLTELDYRTIQRYAELMGSELSRLKLGTVNWTPEIKAGLSGWSSRIMRDTFHHMGAVRMGSSPTEGVVDKDCRVFSLPNLSIASSAVFPTSGSSNPSFTLLALTLRMAQRLKAAL